MEKIDYKVGDLIISLNIDVGAVYKIEQITNQGTTIICKPSKKHKPGQFSKWELNLLKKTHLKLFVPYSKLASILYRR